MSSELDRKATVFKVSALTVRDCADSRCVESIWKRIQAMVNQAELDSFLKELSCFGTVPAIRSIHKTIQTVQMPHYFLNVVQMH